MTSRVMTVTSPVTAVRLLKLYSVGPPSLRNASNQPFMAYSEPLKMVSISTKIYFHYNNPVSSYSGTFTVQMPGITISRDFYASFVL